MKGRCSNPNNPKYPRYGGRGITICDRWLGKDGFQNFISDMGDKPHKGYTLNRIDNDGNYEPSNCEWASRYKQAGNKSNNNETVGVYVKFNHGIKYEARLQVDNKLVLRKQFKTMQEAIAARKLAEERYQVA
jgi:hypothetical protein